MTYSLFSRGRLLGHSELDYIRCIPKHRMGDFVPTELGEKLMSVVTRFGRPCEEPPELELRDADGRVIPTTDISLQDTAALLAVAKEMDDEDFEFDGEDPELEASIMHDMELLDEKFEFDDELDFGPSDDAFFAESTFPRYQIQVFLVDDASMP